MLASCSEQQWLSCAQGFLCMYLSTAGSYLPVQASLEPPDQMHIECVQMRGIILSMCVCVCEFSSALSRLSNLKVLIKIHNFPDFCKFFESKY